MMEELTPQKRDAVYSKEFLQGAKKDLLQRLAKLQEWDDELKDVQADLDYRTKANNARIAKLVIRIAEVIQQIG
jgi:hypothetical protein